MSSNEIDVEKHLQMTWDLADHALEEAQAANDMLSLLLAAVVKSQPEVASELRRTLKALLASDQHNPSGSFGNLARRLCGVLEGNDFHLDSIHPYVRQGDLDDLKKRAFFRKGNPQGGGD